MAATLEALSTRVVSVEKFTSQLLHDYHSASGQAASFHECQLVVALAAPVVAAAPAAIALLIVHEGSTHPEASDTCKLRVSNSMMEFQSTDPYASFRSICNGAKQ